MSAGAQDKLKLSESLSANFFNNFLRHWQAIFSNQQYVRVFRLAVGSTLAVALAFSIEWPLAFLTPVFTVVFLSLPLPKLNLVQGLALMLMTLVAVFIGASLAIFLLPFPLIFIIVLGLGLFHAYYLLNRGGPFWFVANLLISLLLMPMLASIHGVLATSISAGFIISAWVAILMIYLSQFLIPDAAEATLPKKPGLVKGYVPIAADKALKSTIVVLPLATLFIIWGLTDLILVMIFTAIFTLSPDISKGQEAVRNSLISTLIGGAAAFIIYWMCVAVPQLHFFIILYFSIALLFANRIFSGQPGAQFFSSALTTLLVVFHGSLGENKEFVSVFISRISLIAMAGIYVVYSLKALDRYWPYQAKNE